MIKYQLEIILRGFGHKYIMDKIEKDVKRIPFANVERRQDFENMGCMRVSVPFKWMGLYLMKKHKFKVEGGCE